MASIKERNGRLCVIYSYVDEDGKRRLKWETYKTKAEEQKQKKEIEYKESIGSFVIPQCKDLDALLREYVELYGKDKWSLSSYDRNLALINNYIGPSIGQTRLEDINTHFLEKFYQQLLKMPAVPRNFTDKKSERTVGTSTMRDIHKLLRSCFAQAQKWELMEKNPAAMATVPKYKAKKREIWTAETLLHATEVCEDEELKLAMNLAFAGSLRIGELVGLTWNCVDISPEAIKEGRAYIYINKEYQRVTKEAIAKLDGQSAPNLDNLYALSELLRVPMDLLVAGNRSYKPETNLPTGAIRLLRYYRLLYECMAA